MLIKENVVIPYLKKERMLHIYLPDDLQDGERLPVLYMFDGHNLFNDEDATYGKSWGIAKAFEKHDVRAMVVGLECNHYSNYRLCEFSPYSFKDDVWGIVRAKGKPLFKWMVEELKPMIDSEYPTLSDREHTLIGGSSMGGLMAVYGGAIHHDTYSMAACLSPFYDHIFNELCKDIEKVDDLTDTKFYISWGRHEWRTKRALSHGTEMNLKIGRILTKKNAQVYPHCEEFGYHNEASWEKEVPAFINDLGIKEIEVDESEAYKRGLKKDR